MRCVDVAGADAGTDAAAVDGDEAMSASISASVLNAQSAQAFDMIQHADNRISEMLDNNASEKCMKNFFSLKIFIHQGMVETIMKLTNSTNKQQ